MKSQTALSRFARTVALALALAPVLPAQEARLANVSTLTRVGTGADVLTAGFVITGTAPRQVVIRAVGPTLAAAPFNVGGVLANPQLTVYGPDSSTRVAATNDDWAATNAPTFASVGAFALQANSRDAAVVATLAPGAYTAQVSGVGDTVGTALVEVYEAGASASRFVNLSTRAQVSGNTSILTPGFVITAGTGTRKLLIRAAGPALTPLGLAGALPNPSLTLINTVTRATVATNDNWGTPVGATAASAQVLALAFSQAGAFAFPANSQDAAILVDLPAGNYTVQVSGVANSAGIALAEVYDLTPTSPPEVSVIASRPNADESGSKNGEFTFTRSGATFEPLTVRYGVGGSAVNGFDYVNLPGTITIPAGAASVTLPVLPNPDLQNEGTDTVVVTVVSGTNYVAGAQAAATVNISDPPGSASASLYVATISPAGSATTSTASGTATILLSSDNSVASVTFNVSNLSTAVTSAHLQIAPSGDFVFNLPFASSGTTQWLFLPTGNYTSAQLITALKTGNIYVGIDTARFPTGEVRGSFIQGSGTSSFTAPAAPPAISLTNVTATDAARLLTQATFGPKKSEIDALTGGSIDAWLTAQFALPFSSHRQAVLDDAATYGGSGSFTNWNAIHPPNRQSAWWKLALTAPDQLRQRVAFALSQFFVVSDVALGDDNQAEPLAYYYDQLGAGAFGNFRQLLETVTLSPMMGLYLSSLRNSKADPVTGQTPDENYAREVMQLFTIGLVQLQPDGRLVLGSDGLPIATYNQKTITEMAKIFTGWAYPSTSLTAFRTASRNYISPMQLFPSFHDDTAKDLSPVLATPIPAGQGGTTDLRLALDALANHPNTAPFVSTALIKRLVTSNPSPAYVYRVAQVFLSEKNSPTQLASVVRAILTDYEARSPAIAANQSFGKLKEPILRLASVLRSFGATSTSGRFVGFRVTVDGTPITGTTARPATATQISTISAGTRLDFLQTSLAQAPLRSPTVFNFYHPDYVLPGPLAAAGLVAPEFEITDDNFAINVPNTLRTFVLSTVPTSAAGPYTLTLNLGYEESLVSNPSALVDHLNTVLCAGAMPAATKTRITTALAALPTTTTTAERARTAVLLALTSPASSIQK